MNPTSPIASDDPRAVTDPPLAPFVYGDGGVSENVKAGSRPADAARAAQAVRKSPAGAKDPDLVALRASASMASRQFAILWHPLISGMAASQDRENAAQWLVTRLLEMLPDHTVRFGWGDREDAKSGRSRRLVRLLDSRLGWLGADNSIYQSLKTRFEKSPGEEAETAIRWESANLVLELTPDASREKMDDAASVSESDASKRAQPFGMVWIRPPQETNDELQQFAAMVPSEVLTTTATVFFSRPVSGKLGRVASILARWWSRRGIVGIVVLSVLMLACIPVAYRIPASATVTAMNARRVAAPIDATLLVAHVQPGDHVTKGMPLLELDGRPLRIELEAINAEIAEATKDEDIGLAHGQIAQAQLAGLKRKSLLRRRDLISRRLNQLVVASPIDGVVIQGDLHHSLGTPLEMGQTLLEIAPTGSLEIELEIPEVEIGFVDTHAPVEFYFPAIGRVAYRSRVSSIWPSATIRDDENVFIAKTPMPTTEEASGSDHEASTEGNSALYGTESSVASTSFDSNLRVGMRGEAVVLGPTRPWVWKWVRIPLRKIGWVIGW
ncbi:efflux RND transporter periplasmic adaptor subunit [Aporhodopirellula aestuarii]|uniref:HlyD family efflux transporter periplasmic adaptor subunit n=1 Tax=Aporhodopirellula aestuarii TaxID=2950107 RepID=A0ABT0UDR5_9BACT|nr:HlyD family efflux transporter periplasmic adaptor subunit [Aporhodopirellula aestuarii]MCM2374870.1 HlyD family efflux transporter periplasmic adaptor subunit [Aporhodopirellula aestuarii]